MCFIGMTQEFPASIAGSRLLSTFAAREMLNTDGDLADISDLPEVHLAHSKSIWFIQFYSFLELLAGDTLEFHLSRSVWVLRLARRAGTFDPIGM